MDLIWTREDAAKGRGFPSPMKSSQIHQIEFVLHFLSSGPAVTHLVRPFQGHDSLCGASCLLFNQCRSPQSGTQSCVLLHTMQQSCLLFKPTMRRKVELNSPYNVFPSYSPFIFTLQPKVTSSLHWRVFSLHGPGLLGAFFSSAIVLHPFYFNLKVSSIYVCQIMLDRY